MLDANDALRANLLALPPATRLALEATAAPDRAQIDLSTGFPSASVLTPAATWVRIHTSPDPVAAGEALWTKVAPSGDPPLLIVIGLGLGYLLDALERRATATKILAVEPVPAIAQAMLSRRDWTRWISSGQLTLLVGPDYAGAADAWKLLKGGPANPLTIATPLMEREFGEATTQAKAAVAKIVSGAKANDDARKRFAGPYLLNTLANLSVIASEGDAAALTDAFPGRAAVIIGAGPSLDRNIPDLERYQDRAVFIGADTTLLPLVTGGIRPHIIVGVDPSEINAQHLRGVPDTTGIHLVAEGSLHPSAFEYFRGRTFTFKVSNHEPWPWLRALSIERGTLRAWGSVITSAFDLALRMGCNPIIFAGLDLAYTDGRTYCDNTVYKATWEQWIAAGQCTAENLHEQLITSRPTEYTPNVKGLLVRTAPHLMAFRDWLREQTSLTTDRRFVNVTDDGILHGPRIEQLTVTAVLAAAATGPPPSVVMEARHSPSTGDADLVRRSVAQLLACDDSPPTTMGTWRTFAGETVSLDAIREALGRGTLEELASRLRVPTEAPSN